MPRRTNDPVGIRNFVKAPDGKVIISLDFSQIKLRVGAFYCRDENMLQTYRDNGDIHAQTTAVIFDVSYDEEKDKNAPNYKEHRTIAKNCNFGVFYALLDTFEEETEIEGIVWEVYSAEEYLDLSYVLVISGTNSEWTYRIVK